MNTKRITDKYNNKKVWIISKSKCRHYFIQQEVCGRIISKKVRTTKRHLFDIGVLQKGINIMNVEVLTLENNLETDLAKKYFDILIKYEPEEITSYEAEDFEYMILAKDLEGVYEAYGWDIAEVEENTFFNHVCEIPEGNIYILRKEWR